MPKGTAKSKEERTVLYRAVRFEIKPTQEEERLIIQTGDALQGVFNWGHEMYTKAHALRTTLKNEGVRITVVQSLQRVATEAGFPVPDKKMSKTVYPLIYGLTTLRAQDESQGLFRAFIPRNWAEETLDAVDAGFKSFFALHRNGDADARPPRLRDPRYFNEIPGRSSFSVKDGWIALAPMVFKSSSNVGVPLRFKIPAYDEQKLEGAVRLAKFTLFRDEPRLDRPGRYWISLAYAIDKPDELAFDSDEAVYLAVGATWLGVLSSNRQEVIKLWRPDVYWKPLIDEVEEDLKRYTKGSRGWLTHKKALLKKYRMMATQQKKNQREVVARLLKIGVHFVVQDMTIRGGLADASKKERGGALGLNWSVQNTGSIGRLVAWLDEKAKEHGGYVIEHKPTSPAAPGRGRDNKIDQAYRLKASLRQQLDEEATPALSRPNI